MTKKEDNKADAYVSALILRRNAVSSRRMLRLRVFLVGILRQAQDERISGRLEIKSGLHA